MKKIVIILAIVAIAALASSFTFSPNKGQSVDVREVQVGGHSYIVATSTQGGVSIIHSAGCYCLRK